LVFLTFCAKFNEVKDGIINREPLVAFLVFSTNVHLVDLKINFDNL
jgi:hypothetical protein